METLKVIFKDRGYLIYNLPQEEAEKIKEAFDNVQAQSFIIEQDEIPSEYIKSIQLGRC